VIGTSSTGKTGLVCSRINPNSPISVNGKSSAAGTGYVCCVSSLNLQTSVIGTSSVVRIEQTCSRINPILPTSVIGTSSTNGIGISCFMNDLDSHPYSTSFRKKFQSYPIKIFQP